MEEYKKRIGKYLLTEDEIREAEMYIYDEFGVIYYSWAQEVYVENVEIYWEARGKPQNLENEELRKDLVTNLVLR